MVAAGSQLRLTFTRASARLNYLTAQDDAIGLWAVLTIAVAIVLRFAPRWSAPFVAVWAVALVRARPWGWPNQIEHPGDHFDITMWRSGWHVLAVFVATSVLYGYRVASQEHLGAKRYGAAFAAAVLALFLFSTVVVLGAQRAERATDTEIGYPDSTGARQQVGVGRFGFAGARSNEAP